MAVLDNSGDKVKSLMFDGTAYLETHNEKDLIDTIFKALDTNDKPITFTIRYLIRTDNFLNRYDSEIEAYLFTGLLLAQLCYRNRSYLSLRPDAIATFANREIEPVLEILKHGNEE
ncbi:MAG: hypothetical protein LBQ44_06440 [Treponema sp.]|nr:hypothetical protein [Treponema sp.]